MVSDWPLKSVASCAAQEPYSTQIGPFGKALMAAEYVEEGVPVLRGVNVNHGRFHDDDFVFISDDSADRLAKFESFPDDVLLVHKGTLGQIGLMPRRRRHERYIMGNSMLRVRCDPTQLLPEYLYYWLSSPFGQDYLFSRVSQVGVPQLQKPLTTLREAQLPVPPLPTQRAICARLGALDDAIDLGRDMNRTLGQLARAVYSAWFVDFAPVRAKASGAMSFRGMPQSTFDELPSALTNGPAGVMPEGWTTAPVPEIVSLHGGGTPTRKTAEYWGGGIPWFSVRDAPAADEIWVTATSETITEAGVQSSAARVLRPGTSIISARGTVGRLALNAVPMAINQSCYGVEGLEGFGDYFVFFSLERAVAALRQRTHGSVFDTITRQTFAGLDWIRPPRGVRDAFEDAVAPYLALMRANRIEGDSLARIRDVLLPQLVSGLVRLPLEPPDAG